jgi:hypothetical protein
MNIKAQKLLNEHKTTKALDDKNFYHHIIYNASYSHPNYTLPTLTAPFNIDNVQIFRKHLMVSHSNFSPLLSLKPIFLNFQLKNSTRDLVSTFR